MGPRLGKGDVILLAGDVGTGKTHFARCLILACLDQPEDVPSPTYTLVQSYPTPQGEIWHADLYRLSNPDEIEELGLQQAFTDAICLIEWPDRLGSLSPPSALTITLAVAEDENARRIDLDWSDPRWNGKLDGIADV